VSDESTAVLQGQLERALTGDLGRRAVGCELNEEFACFGRQRVRDAVGDEDGPGGRQAVSGAR
jgi:hypothetical protein